MMCTVLAVLPRHCRKLNLVRATMYVGRRHVCDVGKQTRQNRDANDNITYVSENAVGELTRVLVIMAADISARG